ncbi:hypothetical protein BDV33DRAFT_210948 [Aspergillus novoparasiticus]|uniref:Uncharacterized protein n=1 Tax=Aspergillus novoparasiticus TaxID=986946 RepID=A0A5N6E599_9EURO|nr:hypothetical protein BDV33DRAFT_210948 [Aspergillus novoparasiticus]
MDYILGDLYDHSEPVAAHSFYSEKTYDTYYTAASPVELPVTDQSQASNRISAPDQRSAGEGGSLKDLTDEAKQHTFCEQPVQPPDSTENPASELTKFDSVQRKHTERLSENIFGPIETEDLTNSGHEQGHEPEEGSAEEPISYNSVAPAEPNGQDLPASPTIPESPRSQENCIVKPGELAPQEAGQSGSLKSRNSTRGTSPTKPLTLASITRGSGSIDRR